MDSFSDADADKMKNAILEISKMIKNINLSSSLKSNYILSNYICYENNNSSVVKQGKKTKIVLVGYRLANGGLERVLSTVSDLLHYSNCEVHVIVLENEVEYPVHGTLINLGNYSK
mgnify:CR=1 FL=1